MTDGLPLLLALFLVAWAASQLYAARRRGPPPRSPLPGERWHNKTLGIVEVVSVTPQGTIIRYRRETLDPAPICYCSRESWNAAGMTVCTLEDLEEHHQHGKPL